MVIFRDLLSSFSLELDRALTSQPLQHKTHVTGNHGVTEVINSILYIVTTLSHAGYMLLCYGSPARTAGRRELNE